MTVRGASKTSYFQNISEKMKKKGIEVPFVVLESILAATDNFSEANKHGEGGFGPVYKVIW